MFVLGRPFQLSIMFANKAGVYPSVTPFRCSTLGKALGLATNTRLGWESPPETNTLAYYEHFKIIAVQSFITLDPDL